MEDGVFRRTDVVGSPGEATKDFSTLTTCTFVDVRGGEPGLEFEAWYRAEWPRLVATFSMVAGDRDVGYETAAEATARAFERWARVSRMDAPSGWTYTVGLNLLRRRYRRAALERRALQRANSIQPTLAMPVVSVEVWDAVQALPPRERTMVALRYGADRMESEIAELLKVAPGTVSATLHHARASLRAVLGDEIDEVHDGRS
jgi:RNA polymerase sigma factor (sigma-70 family)